MSLIDRLLGAPFAATTSTGARFYVPNETLEITAMLTPSRVDTLHLHTAVALSVLDRVRVLFTGRLKVFTRLPYEVIKGEHGGLCAGQATTHVHAAHIFGDPPATAETAL